MEYNYSYAFPTPDKTYIKLLAVYSKFGNSGVWFGDASKIAFPNKCRFHCVDVFKNMRAAGYYELIGKSSKKDIWKITKKGQDLLNYAMQFNKTCEFLKLAERSNSYPEFKMNSVLEAHGEFATHEFYENNVKPLAEGKIPEDQQCNIDFGENIDSAKVARHVYNKFWKIAWFKDYLEAMKSSDIVSNTIKI